MVTPTLYLARALARLNALLGRGLVVSIGVILLVGFALSAAVFAFMSSAAPNTLTITSGPPGSVFERNAEKYKKILAREGVTLKIVPSGGSRDNFKNLAKPKSDIDVGFVLSGEVSSTGKENLMSLGSISYQPLMVFYRGKPKGLLSDFKGQRLDIGPEESGTHALALALLKANGIEPGKDTELINETAGDSALALIDGRIDALFLMGDSASTAQMRQLLRTPDVHLFNFAQADGYTRRIGYLNKLELPRGAIDFGKDIPPETIQLLGPTVELVARDGLHPALSDLLLEAAREVHGSASLFRKRGEFPAPLEHDFRISPDATRYYASGKSFLYRNFPFLIASLITRTLAVVLPLALFLIPALKIAPAIYRWRMESRIYRWYRALFDLERDAFRAAGDMKRRDELLRHLDHIERGVDKVIVPASFGDLLYGLRGHISFVRERLLTQYPPG